MNKSLLERLLEYYDISYDEYLKITQPVDLSNFAAGHEFKDMDKAVTLVNEVISNNGKIMVYGDYDADGMMGTSILTKMFSYIGYVNSYYLPNRYQDGYGITLKHAEEYVQAGFKLVITVDNGISAFESIEYLHNHGVKVLILDHHQMQQDLPKADVIIHPIISEFGSTPSSGAFTAFMFSISFLKRTDKYLATLASISLISDMMPILDYNRSLLRAVINSYTPGEFLPIHLLSDGDKFDENCIGMKIAPRINSIGRLVDNDSINDVIKFFTTNDEEYILNYFSHILEMNEERKNLIKNISINDSISASDKAIVIKGDYKEGIIGLIANSLSSKYGVPAIVFAPSLNDELKGSARAPVGFDIVKIFTALSPLLTTYGGHALAGGCSIKNNDYDQFKKSFISLAESIPFEKQSHQNIPITIAELTTENYELINSFSPFGESWKAPVLKLNRIKTDVLTYSRDQNHILSYLGFSLKLTGFNCKKEDVSRYQFINITGYLRKNSYKGKTFLEFTIKEYSESK